MATALAAAAVIASGCATSDTSTGGAMSATPSTAPPPTGGSWGGMTSYPGVVEIYRFDGSKVGYVMMDASRPGVSWWVLPIGTQLPPIPASTSWTDDLTWHMDDWNAIDGCDLLRRVVIMNGGDWQLWEVNPAPIQCK
jgi:hypothetical protein